MTSKNHLRILAGLILLLIMALSHAQSLPTLPEDDNQLAYEIYKELIETNTTDSVGDNTLAAEKIARWLRAGGFPQEDIFIGGKKEKKGNLVARLHGTGANKPFILLAHLDVVEAKRADWTMDPFTLRIAKKNSGIDPLVLCHL